MRLLTILFFIAYVLYMSVNPPAPIARIHSPESDFNKQYEMIKEGIGLLKDGDLVLRLNGDIVSAHLKDFNRNDKSYSHAGIVLFEGGQPWIYHIVNGEGKSGEDFRRDSLRQFCDPGKNEAFGIFRYQFSKEELKKLHDIVGKWRNKKVSFDFSFDLESDNKMYCSEMVGKALASATANRISIQPAPLTPDEAKIFAAYIHQPYSSVKDLQVVPMDALYINPNCTCVKRYVFDKAF